MPNGTDDDGAACDVVRRLLEVVAGRYPPVAALPVLSENLTAYMDGVRIGEGCAMWLRWVGFLHYQARRQFAEFGLQIDDVTMQNGVVVVRAKWQGMRDGQRLFSDVGEVAYLVEAGKIVKIWTHRRNYIFIHGRRMAESRLAFWWLLLRVALWRGGGISGADGGPE